MTSVQQEGQPPSLYGSGNRWAVLVGVNDYTDKNHFGTLRMSVGDTTKISEVLNSGGFEQGNIHLLTDREQQKPLREAIIAELKAVAAVTDSDDLLLFYFSGHGVEKGGEIYLMPQNGMGIAPDETGLSIRYIKKIMEEAKARAKVILLDACHSGTDGPAKGSQEMSEEFIKNVFKQAAGMAILSSCRSNQFSYEWKEKQCSVFTYYLLEALEGKADRSNKGFVTVLDVNLYVTDGVKSWASQNRVIQVPILSYLVSGDILLTTIQEPGIIDPEQYVVARVLGSAREYLATVLTVVEESLKVFGRKQVWVSDCQSLLKLFEKIEKPAFIQKFGTRFITNARLYPLSLSLFAIDDKKDHVRDLIAGFGQSSSSAARQIAARQKAIYTQLTSLSHKITDASTLIGSMERPSHS
jgi:hypothetical protein